MEGSGSARKEMEVEDFNQALDRILDIFSNDLQGQYNEAQIEYTEEDEELLRAEETYNRLTADTRENDAKRIKLQLAPSIPKIMKNDIRRYYSRMFMNTINSGDFVKLQDYFSTFMTGPCRFVAKHIVDPEFEIPDTIISVGPRIMSHYCLGCLVMYPDLVMAMRDSKIVTSNSWMGSQIVMDVQIKGTKMYDIDFGSWVPQLATLDECYHAAVKASVLAIAVASDNDKAVNVNTSANPVEVSVEAYPAAETAASAPDPEIQSFHIESSVPVPGPQKVTQPPPDAVSSEVATVYSVCSSTSTSDSTTANTTNTMKKSANITYIPEAFIHALFAHAKLLPRPQPLTLHGQITMYLDENHHIQHMCETLTQDNT